MKIRAKVITMLLRENLCLPKPRRRQVCNPWLPILILLFSVVASFTAWTLTADEYYDQGVTEYLLDNLSAATAGLELALTLDPSHSRANGLLTTIKREQETAAHLKAGTNYYRKGKWKETILEFENLLALNPGHTEASRYLQEAQAKLRLEIVAQEKAQGRREEEARKKKEKARRKQEEARRRETEEARRKEAEEARRREAEEARKREEERKRKGALIAEHYQVGEKYYEIGQFSQAIAEFKEVLALVPEHKEASAYLSRTQEELSRRELLRKTINITLMVLGLLALLGGLILFKVPGRIMGFIKKVRAEREMVRKGYILCPACKMKNPRYTEFCYNCGEELKAWSRISEREQEWLKKHNWSGSPFISDLRSALFVGHKEKIKALLETIETQKGHSLITGEVGTGKTMLLRWLERNLPDQFYPCYIARPPQPAKDPEKIIFGCEDKERYTLSELKGLPQKLNKILVLLFDDAHLFDLNVEGPLASLGGMEKVIFVLAGLPEIKEKFKTRFSTLFSKVITTINLDRLSLEETRGLIVRRIEEVGGNGYQPFTEGAIDEIYRLSGGLPRTVVGLCEQATIKAVHQGLNIIDASLLKPEEELAPEKVKIIPRAKEVAEVVEAPIIKAEKKGTFTNIKDLLYKRGLVYYQRGKLSQAMNQWEKVLELDPLHQRTRNYMKEVRKQLPTS